MKEKKKPEGRARRRDFRSRSGNAPKHEADAAKKSADQWQVGGGLLLWKFPIEKGCTLKSITSIYIFISFGAFRHVGGMSVRCRGLIGNGMSAECRRYMCQLDIV